MIEFAILILTIITYWYYQSKKNKLTKDEKRKQIEEKAKMEFYGRIHTSTEPHIKSHHQTKKN